MSGQEQVLDNSISFQMNDDGGGTYSYSYIIGRPGDVTVNILKYNQNKIYSEFYPNRARSGPSQYQNFSDDLSNDWGEGNVYNNVEDDVGAKYFFKLKPPVSGTYALSMYVDDEGILKLDGNTVMSRSTYGDTSGSVYLDANKFYDGSFYWSEGNGE